MHTMHANCDGHMERVTGLTDMWRHGNLCWRRRIQATIEAPCSKFMLHIERGQANKHASKTAGRGNGNGYQPEPVRIVLGGLPETPCLRRETTNSNTTMQIQFPLDLSMIPRHPWDAFWEPCRQPQGWGKKTNVPQ